MHSMPCGTTIKLVKVLFIILFVLKNTLSANPLNRTCKVENQIAVVNVDYVLSNAKIGKSLTEYIKSVEAKITDENILKKNQIINQQNLLNKKKKNISKKNFEIQRKYLMEQSFHAQKNFDKNITQLRQVVKKCEDQIYKILKDVISHYSINKNLSLVIKIHPVYQTTILYSDPGLDISKDIISALNNRITNVKTLLVDDNRE